MSEKKENKTLAPPYIAFKTFTGFIEKIRVGVPSRIDRSLMHTYSGAVQSQLITTLKFLKLTSDAGIPTATLKKYVEADGEEKKKALREIIESAYPFLFSDGINLTAITSNQLEEHFEEAGAGGGTTRKSIAFFIAAAKDAGIGLSPHIKVRKSPVRRSKPKSKKPASASKKQEYAEGPSQGSTPPAQDTTDEIKIWLDKFPDFDPTWPDDVKAKWFDGFKDLRSQFKGTSDNKKGGSHV